MELFRIFKNKKFIAAVILLLLFNCAAFYITQQKSIEDLGVNLSTYSKVFHDNEDIFKTSDAKDAIMETNSKFQILKNFSDTEKLKAENLQEYEFFAEEEAQLIKDNQSLYQEYISGKYTHDEITALSDFYSHFAYQLEYQNGYNDYIESIIEKGKNLSTKKLFSDKSTFSYKSIQKSTHDFAKNENLKLSLVNDYPASSVLNYQLGDFILILLCVFLAISFTAENHVNQLLNTCKNGRKMLKLKQLPILVFFALICSAVIHIAELLISLNIYNASFDFYAPIQSCDMFADCIMHIHFLQLFAVLILFKALVALMISLVIWLLISLNSNIILVSAISGMIAATELLMYKNISAQSHLSFFKTFNIFSLFDCKSITQYNLISCFSTAIRADILIWIITLTITVGTSFAVLFSAKHNYPIKTPNKISNILNKALKKLSLYYNKFQNVFYRNRFETFKIMHIGKGILIFAAFLAVIGFSFNNNPLAFSSNEMFLNDYYEQYGGELNQEIYESIEKMQAELEHVDAEFNIKNNQYLNHEISFEEYELARAKSAAYDTQRKAVNVLTLQIDRIEKLANKNIKPMLINEIGFNNLFYSENNQTEILLLLCTAVLLFSSVFSIEKTANMTILNHCAENGRKQLYYKKIFTVIPKTFVLTTISYSTMLFQNDFLYQLDNFNANIHNLQCLQDVNLNLSIFEYIVLNFLFEFLFVTVAAFIISALSAFMPQLAVIISGACLFILPGALYMISIYSAKNIAASYLFNFNSLILDKGLNINSFIIHFALIFVCIILLWLCRQKCCITKDR